MNTSTAVTAISLAETPLWADNPTADDLLGFEDIAEPLLEALRRDRLDPVALGVFGDWGSGKTTVLEIIRKRLAEDPSVVVVYTRPWEYDPNTDPKATLIAEVLTAVRTRVEDEDGSLDRLGEEVVKRFKRLASRIKWSKAITMTATSAVTLTLPRFSDVVDIFNGDAAEDEVAEPTLQGFRDEFETLMSELDEISRVIVLVDDLDRCLPASVISSLEAIKLFLSVPKMAFVVAADRRLVTHAISTRYEPAARAHDMAVQYLEKIVQIPVGVPSLGITDTETYLALLLLQRHFESDRTGLTKVVMHCNTRRAQAAPRLLDDLPPDAIPSIAQSDLALASMLAPVLADRMNGNPRRLKRFLNAFWIRSAIAARRQAQLDEPALAKLMVLEETDSDNFATLLDWLGSGELTKRLAALESEDADGSANDAHPLREWARERPHLSEYELDPYLRLAASLRSLPTPATGLRSDLRELLEQLTDKKQAVRRGAQKRAVEMQVEDRLALVRELVALVRAEPNRQADIAESLAEFASKDDVAASEIVRRLDDFDVAKIKPALVIRLGGAGSTVRPLIEKWVASDRLPQLARNAAEKVLQAKEER